MRHTLHRGPHARCWSAVPLFALGLNAAGGCSAPEGEREVNAGVSRARSSLTSAPCEPYHVISSEPAQSRCESFSGSGGRWAGRLVSRTIDTVYCSYSWVPAAGGGASSGGASVRPPTDLKLDRGANASPVGPSGSSVPVLPLRPLGPLAGTGGVSAVSVNPIAIAVRPRGTNPPKPPPAQGPDLRVLARLKQVEVDCPVLASLAAPTPVGPADVTWMETRRDTHRKQAGWVRRLPESKSRIEVAVIDSAARPYASPLDDTYDHGRTMGRVIADLGCPLDGASACPAEIVNHLALPLRTPAEEDTLNGGYYGTRAHLAAAISQAVAGWQAVTSRAVAPRLVLNLSVGWDASHGGAYEKDFRELNVASQAVYAALLEASCMGALSIASAGNRSAPDDSGIMYPAGWEAVVAPDEQQCANLGWRERPNQLPVFKSATSYRPLVYAIGGVDAQDQPLTNARPLAQPRLVAHALAVVAEDPPRGGWTSSLTGSSLAAAVSSGVATAAWSYRPELTAHDLMELVYQTAVELDPSAGTTEHCLPTSLPCSAHAIRRVSACETLAKVLAISPLELGCETVPAHKGEALAAGVPDATVYPPLPDATECPPPGCVMPAGAVPKSEQPWVGPQPGYPSCDNCYVWAPAQALYVSLKPGTTGTLKHLMLRAHMYGATPTYEIQHPIASDYPAVFAVTLPGTQLAYAADLIAVHDAGYSTVTVTIEEPVPVY